METQSQMDRKVVAVLESRLPEALEALKKLADKARRYGNPDITVTVGETYTAARYVEDWDGEERKVSVQMVELVIEGEAPRIGQHEFLAHIELHEGGNLVDTRPGIKDLDARFRHTNGYCDHCQTLRQRKDVYVVRDTETGTQLQIGRTCLRDYMGCDNPGAIAHRFALWAAVEGEFEERYGRGKAEWSQSIEGLLSLSAVCIRLFGWCSQGQAQFNESLTPTGYYVRHVLFTGIRESDSEKVLRKQILDARTEADRETARETMRWVREELTADSDYNHNLKVLFSADAIHDPKRMGIVISAVAAYLKAKEKALRLTQERTAAAKSQHVGSVGERLRNLKVSIQSQRVVGSNEWGETVLITFVDEAGNILKWFTGKGTGHQNGEQVLLTGTVKKHDQFNGHDETTLARCSVKDI